MKSFHTLFNENTFYVTPSQIVEFTFCNRFVYFMKCLGIPQNADKHYKVNKGNKIHENREVNNTEYIRKSVGAIDKNIGIELTSKKYQLKGKVDELLTLEDETLAPLDYKYTPYKGYVYKTHQLQITLYAIMAEEMYHQKVDKGFVVYCRNENSIQTLEITDKLKLEAIETLDNYQKVLNGYYPMATKDQSKCEDCCYKNICIK